MTQATVVKKPTAQIRTQKYAEIAYPLVEDVKNDAKMEAKYRTLALAFPTMIMQSGLVQAIGFLMAKNEDHHKKILDHLTKLLDHQITPKDLYKKIYKSDIAEYQLLTRKAIEASGWLKRYAQALLKDDKEK
ncbi:type III-B CRISPR module-associated protein Cmr5 [Moraxella cuniculi]|uniref:CRISPR type III-B/RAMP module-associated protein Cmr5 n=1 Tax=Moraxella cuniculi TaxID=34061 RepID=A0A3S4QZR3_9GAMM|nr:type III-B CRISPR module-associated protein Cmr5 [Moraxella cuniculi]VEG12221.1 CRISPR type III-B/RAMP module-associated protein Cmr5 [Moraxella cuniculi]